VFALDDVSLSIGSGELVALLGPSGSGKTTLLRIIAGLEIPDAGSVHLGGEEATGRSARERGVGFVFQHYALFRHMTVFENAAFGLRVRPRRRRPSEQQIRARVDELLKLVQLEWAGERYPSQLSGGQRQRVALARALAAEPRVLLLDEPFGALDALTRGNIQEELLKIVQATHQTVFMITHDVDEAILLADKILLMSKGPNARIAEIVEVTMRRDRSRSNVHHDPQYYRIRNHLLDFLVNRCQAPWECASGPAHDARHPPVVRPGIDGELAPASATVVQLPVDRDKPPRPWMHAVNN
jgi:nitrate/nitrite transport system ATP-binding protein